ncbi:MAG: ABC transporter substrate-binding protein [Acetobacteraceae bacterium]|nr:ABC transporter substrate-binding protein [Acetobacteraceae bacterium]
MSLPRRALLAAPALVSALGASVAEAQQAQPLRIGMSLNDIPRMWGGPEAGFEGLRFGGYLVYDALINWDLSRADAPSGLVPGLATAWRADAADRRRWVITLRRNVRFHDGTPFDADAAIWNFDSIFNTRAPQFDGPRAGLVRTRLSSYEGIEKVDDLTIAIRTTEVDGMFPYQLSFLFFASPSRWRELGGDWSRFLTQPAGTGPYRLTNLVPRQRAELEANRDYWDERRIPKAARTALLPIPDHAARVAALRANQIDIAETLTPDAIPSLRAARFQIVQNPYPHIWAWRLNVQEGSPFHDLRVRQAANLAVDRDGMVSMLAGSAQAARGKVTPDHPWFGEPGFRLRYDLPEARRLMQAAGYGPQRRAAVNVIMPVSGGGQMTPQPMSEAIQANLREAFFDVTFQPVDFVTALNLMRAGARDQANRGAHALNIAIPSLDPTTGWIIYDSGLVNPRGVNWGYYNSPAVDAQLRVVRQQFDTAAQDREMGRLHNLLVEEAAGLYVVHDLNPRGLSPRVRGFVQARNWFQDYTQITLA